jgi:TPR repeat protein
MGVGIERDVPRAVQQYKLSADQGNAWGQANYGRCLVHGIGRPVDVSAGAVSVKKAADRGLGLGQYTYGFLLEKGLGVEKDKVLALEFYRLAMEQGHVKAKGAFESLAKGKKWKKKKK